MFLTITDDHSGAILQHRALSDSEILNPDFYAEDFAMIEGLDLSTRGNVPLGCGDFTVELGEYPLTGSCWISRSYCAQMGEY